MPTTSLRLLWRAEYGRLSRLATHIAVLATILSLCSSLFATPVHAAPTHAPQPSHTPNTLARFQSQTNAASHGPHTVVVPPTRRIGPPQGLPPGKAAHSAGANHIPPITIPLDAHYLATSPITKQATGAWFTNSDTSVAIYIANNAVDVRAATLASSAGATSAASAAPAGPFTLQLTQTEGSYRGDSLSLATFALQILDGQGRALDHAQLTAPIQLRLTYGPEDLSGLNAADVRLVWPATANTQTQTPPQSIPFTLDATADTLTATLTTLNPGPAILSATMSDANAASSEHPLVAGNTGDLTLPVSLQAPPAAGGLAPDLTLTYSSAGTNGRDRQAPAAWTGEGWDLSFGSITYDATTGSFYLNGVGGVNEVLLCCVVDSAHGNTNYFMPHHHDDLHVTTSNNSTHPNTTGSSFTVRTPDGTEYDFGATADSLRSTVTAGAKTYYEWDLNKVIRRASASAGYLQQYTIAYWQDTATSGGVTYVRDAAPREIDENFVNGSADARVYFNVHWPHSTTTTGPATATTYGNNYHCASAPLVTTTLRCDDPITQSGWEAAPLTMSTVTLDQVVMQVWNQGAWNTVRRYDLTYGNDTPATSCTDDVTGGLYACAGEHLLTSVQEIPYQSGSAMPSRQPIAFTYTATLLDEYHDYTHNGFDSNPFDAQRRWQYLATYTDNQTGAGASVQWKTAWGNTNGVPSGQNVLDPLTCGYQGVSCSHTDDRQWMRQTVTSITDTGSNTTTSYLYRLNPACGSACTQDTWIAPNSYNACNGQAQGPSNPMPSCLIQGPYTNYYNEDYTGFLQVTITHPDGSTSYTQYYAGDGWGTNDWQFPNVYHGFAQIEDIYQGAATGAPLDEVDHTYIASNCPTIDSNGNQLIVNGYMLCNSYETQRDTYIGGSSGSSGVPHLTETWAYDGLTGPALGMQYHELLTSAVTSNDALADSFTNYGTTQPTFTTTYTYARHDGTLDSPATTTYLAGLVAQATLTDNQGTIWTCRQNQYDDQQTYTTGQDTALVAGLATRSTAWAICSSHTGPVTTSAGYDIYGQPVVSTDADAWAGDATHTGCAAPSTLYLADNAPSITSYTACVTHDSEQQVYPTLSANAKNYQTTNTYDVVQGALLTSKDPNNATTTGGAPVYEYSGSPSLATFQDVYTQTTLPPVTGSPSWTTRTYVYSFCAGATTGSKPCLEVDTVRNYDSTNSDMLVSRAFYDRDGRVVETRATSAIDGQDSVSVTAYSDSAATTWTSLPCSVPALTTSTGGRTSANDAYYIAPTQTSSGSSAYVDPATVSGMCAAATLTGTTTYTDALGRAIASDDPLGTGVGASGTGCLLAGSSSHHTTCASYAAVVASSVAGLPSTDAEPYLQTVSVDANLHQSATYTDALGRLAYTQTLSGASQTPWGSGIASYGVTQSQYDPTGALHRVYNALGQASVFKYDGLGHEVSIQDMNRGGETYAYDANGNVTQTTDARGSTGTIYAGYDGLNRQVWRNTTASPTGAYVTYAYDTGTNGKGRLAGETFTNANAGGSLSGCYAYSYDARGRVTATTEQVGSTTCTSGSTTTASYNDANRLTSQVYPNGDTLTTNYDSTTGYENGLALTPSGGSQGWLLTSFVYSGQSGAAGLLSGATLGMGSASVSYSYDGLLRPSETWYSSGATTLYRVQPVYDAVGNVSGETTTLPQGVDTQVFCYDEQDRLTWAGTTGTAPCSSSLTPGSFTGATYSASYTYDATNRLRSSPLGSYTYGDNAHVDAATAIGGTNWTGSYDASGNLTCRAPSSATTCAGTPSGNYLGYDNEGQLALWANTQANPTSTASFLYDGAGQRVQQVVMSGGTTTTTTYIGSLEELTTTGSTTTTTAYYGGVALAVNGVLSYTLSDSLGSVSAALSTAGVMTASQLYGPYGAVRYQNGSMPGTHGFTGQRADAATGLDYYGARYYDPLAGQFISADTTLAGGLNRYAYVGGNPETRTDPTGHMYTFHHNPNFEDTHGHDHYAEAMYNLFLQDGTAADGSPLAAYMMLNDPMAYSAADVWAVGHGQIGVPNVARDSYLYIGAMGNAYWNSSGAHMAEFQRLDTFKGEYAMEMSGSGMKGSSLEFLAPPSGENPLVAEIGGDRLGRGGGGSATSGDVAAGGGGCGLSFAAETLVATPGGERPIAGLKVGDPVLAYNPATRQQTTQTVARMFLNHDHDRLDVTLALPSAGAGATGTATAASPTRTTETARERGRRLASHGLRAPPDADATATEVIHTTANHPWLTADHGWRLAGDLRVGEAVRLLDGGTARVVGLRALPGVGLMWDLSLDSVHTFAVGNVQTVVHNCPRAGDGGDIGSQRIGGRTGDIVSTQPGDYLAGKAPSYGDPNSVRDGVYVNDIGQVQPWRAHYDEFGRLIARTDYNAANPAAGIPPVHYHLYEWGPGYDWGREIPGHIPGEYEP